MAKEKKSTRSAGSTVSQTGSAGNQPNPVWFKPVMFGFMLLGLVWILVYYLSSSMYPVPNLGAWNIAIGFAIMFIGFVMTMRWR